MTPDQWFATMMPSRARAHRKWLKIRYGVDKYPPHLVFVKPTKISSEEGGEITEWLQETQGLQAGVDYLNCMNPDEPPTYWAIAFWDESVAMMFRVMFPDGSPPKEEMIPWDDQ